MAQCADKSRAVDLAARDGFDQRFLLVWFPRCRSAEMQATPAVIFARPCQFARRTSAASVARDNGSALIAARNRYPEVRVCTHVLSTG